MGYVQNSGLGCKHTSSFLTLMETLYVCMHVMCVCNVCMCIDAYMYARVYVYFMYACMYCACARICVYASMYVCTMHVRMCIYICLCVCMYVRPFQKKIFSLIHSHRPSKCDKWGYVIRVKVMFTYI